MSAAILFLVFAFGLIIGSFLNVCISRLPEGLSIVKPRSRCPKCLKPISFYDNIPLVSFLVLRGRCRGCSAPIPWRYPAVELLSGTMTLLLFMQWNGSPLWLAASLAAAYTLLTAAVIDFETMLISDLFPCILVALGLLSSTVNPYFDGAAYVKVLGSLGGAAAGAALIWVMSFLGRKIYKKEAVGEGDILLMAGIGSLTGWQGVLSTLILASFFGSVYGVSLMAAKRAKPMDAVPFGPFLAIGAIINLYRLVRLTDFLFY